jgi:hypothetical protein
MPLCVLRAGHLSLGLFLSSCVSPLRFAVTGPPFIRFYCGIPLLLDGIKLGTLCVIDTKPRSFSRLDFMRVVNALEQLSRLAMRHIMEAGQPAGSMGSVHRPRCNTNACGAAFPGAAERQPLSSIVPTSPLGRVLGLDTASGHPSSHGTAAGAPEAEAGSEGAPTDIDWSTLSSQDFELLIGQLLELVDASYIQVAACDAVPEPEEPAADREAAKVRARPRACARVIGEAATAFDQAESMWSVDAAWRVRAAAAGRTGAVSVGVSSGEGQGDASLIQPTLVRLCLSTSVVGMDMRRAAMPAPQHAGPCGVWVFRATQQP